MHEFDENKAFEYLSTLANKIGPRLTGSSSEHKAAKYIQNHFESCGLMTSIQKFPVTTYENLECSFAVKINNQYKKISCEPFMPSINTPDAGLEGEIYFAETGTPEYLSADMRDKIVLVYGDINSEDRLRFIAYKPKALIRIDQRIRSNISIAGTNVDYLKTYGDIPTVFISHLDGLDIIKNKLKIGRLILRNKTTPSYSLNVIGEIKGYDQPDDIIVVCGHYDSHMGTAGASDNAGGTAIMMELARILSARKTRRTIRFIAFAAEETGLYGSTHYAEQLLINDQKDKNQQDFNPKIHKSECDQHRLTFNLDVHGVILGKNIALFCGCDDIGAAARLLAKEQGIQMDINDAPMSSDGTPLAAAGIPTIQLARYGGATIFGHTRNDDTKYLAPQALKIAGIFSEIFLKRYITDCPVLPFKREISDEQKNKIKKYFKRGSLRNPTEIIDD